MTLLTGGSGSCVSAEVPSGLWLPWVSSGAHRTELTPAVLCLVLMLRGLSTLQKPSLTPPHSLSHSANTSWTPRASLALF